MNLLSMRALSAILLCPALPLMAAPSNVWSAESVPALPLRYVETMPVLRLTPQIANAETYAPNALFLQLYPSIDAAHAAAAVTIEPVATSKTRVFGPNRTRGILSSSYVQELAYVDTYSNIRKYEDYFNFPSIRLSLAMPQFGNGFGGGYQPLQFGFGPAAFGFR